MTKARAKTKQKRLKTTDVPALPAPEYVFDPEVIKAGQEDEVCKSIQVLDSSKKTTKGRKKKKNTEGISSKTTKKSKKSSSEGNLSGTEKKSAHAVKQLPDKLVTEIQGIILIALSLMLLTGLTINSDSLLCSFSNVLTRLAGYGAYLFSLLFWLWGFERFRGRTFFRGYMDYLAWSVSFLTLIFLSQSISSSGGSVGETLWPIVNRITGPAGATVFLAALSIISFLLVAEILFSDFIVNTGRFIVWASVKGGIFMKWLMARSEKGFEVIKSASVKIFELLQGFYSETFGSSRAVDDSSEYDNNASASASSAVSGESLEHRPDSEKQEDTFSSAKGFDAADEFTGSAFSSDKESFVNQNDFDDPGESGLSDDFDDSDEDEENARKASSEYSKSQISEGMSNFAREEIVMEPCDSENSSEFVSRIDAILGNTSNQVDDQQENKADIKPPSEEGFLARGLKKMSSLIPGSSSSWQGPDEDDFEVETFETEDDQSEADSLKHKMDRDSAAISAQPVKSADYSSDMTSGADRATDEDRATGADRVTGTVSDSGADIESGAAHGLQAGTASGTVTAADSGSHTADAAIAAAGTSPAMDAASNSDTESSEYSDDGDDFYEPLMGEPEEEEEEDIFFQLPPITLLDEVRKTDTAVLEAELREKGEIIISTLMEFKIKARILEIVCGPSVTQFQIQIAKGVKVSKVLGLQENIGMNLAIHSVRIEAPIPGKSAIGVEIPNSIRTPVHFREIVENMLVKNKGGILNMGFGKDIAGRYVCADLARMPHLLVAGATGSGKSVCMNTIICSILFESTPKDVKFIMVDPKMVEMTVYKDIPHLLVPPIIDAKEAAAALNWCVEEMEKRYELLSLFGVRNIESFNDHIESGEIKAKAARLEPEDYAKLGPLKKMPYIVVVIDELADLMLVASKDVETSISRIAAKARAIGIHLVIATQRPSVNVITGVIKANLPSRIAFAVSSVVDSKTILDRKGAELLLGRGDMLFSPVGQRKPTRLQGAFISDEEVERLCDFLRDQSVPDYNPEITRIADDSSGEEDDISDLDNYLGRDKELVIKAARHVVETNFASASGLQRNLRIGYARAGRVVDILEKLGIISSKDSKNNRKILMTSDEVEELFL
jgi:S-DNA-T family DNA segregation ATPase FtsK/SpoIIIE